jgi:hypothetical protein
MKAKQFNLFMNWARPFNVFLVSTFLTLPSYSDVNMLNILNSQKAVMTDPEIKGDDRIRINISTLEHAQIPYTVYAIDIDPKRWNPDVPGTDLDIFERHFADTLLRSTHKFLANVHIQNQDPSVHNPVHQMILQSFDKKSDPFGRLDWTDAGKALHKVDDYFDHKGLILIVARGNSIKPEDIVGTIKFIQSPAERSLSPILGGYRGFLPPTAVEKAGDIVVEYENLARSNTGASPVPLLLKYAIDSDFFKDLSRVQPNFQIVLNAEDPKVGFHEKFSFRVLDGYYEGLKAKRMAADFVSFAGKVEGYYQSRVLPSSPRSADSLSLAKMQTLPWQGFFNPNNIWTHFEAIESLQVPFIPIPENRCLKAYSNLSSHR